MTRLPDLLRRLADDPRPDGDLLAAFRSARDEAAFAAVVRRHGGLVWGVCRRTLPDPADAEDAFQASFLVLVRRSNRLTRAVTVGPWLHRTAVLVCRNLRRKNARRLARTAPLPPDVPTPEPPPVPDIDALLLSLSEQDRSAIVLCCLQGRTRREAAEQLGVPEGTVNARLSRGLAKLRSRFAGALPAVAFVPPAVADAAVRSAVTASSHLAEGVFPMAWLKKLATAVTLAAGVAVGVGGLPDRPPAPLAAATAPATEPNDPISQLLRLEATADRLAREKGAEAAGYDLELLAHQRKEWLQKIDYKTRTQHLLFVAVRPGPDGSPVASVYEYTAEGQRAAHAAGSLAFLERHLDRITKADELYRTKQVRSELPYSLALHLDPALPPAVAGRVFAVCRDTKWHSGWMTGIVPADPTKAGVERPQSGGEIRYYNGRAEFRRIWVSFGRSDAFGAPEVIRLDMRC